MPINGFVYVIESPSSRDLLDGRTEGRVLTEALRLAEIPHWYSLASDKNMLLEALGQRLNEAWSHHSKFPILHLSMHGNHQGVSLTNGEFLAWHEMRELLLPLIRAMNGGLLVCMSSCFGSAGCRMAMYEDKEPHFWALVGNISSALWADAAIAYISFSRGLASILVLIPCKWLLEITILYLNSVRMLRLSGGLLYRNTGSS